MQIRRGWTTEVVTACYPALPGCSATAPNEKLALEQLRARLDELQLRQILAEHAQAAAEELDRRVAAERAGAEGARPAGPRPHATLVGEPAAPAAAAGVPATDGIPRPTPAPSPMRGRTARWPSVDHCITSLVHDVLRKRALN